MSHFTKFLLLSLTLASTIFLGTTFADRNDEIARGGGHGGGGGGGHAGDFHHSDLNRGDVNRGTNNHGDLNRRDSNRNWNNEYDDGGGYYYNGPITPYYPGVYGTDPADDPNDAQNDAMYEENLRSMREGR